MAIGGLATQPSAITYELEDLMVHAWQGNIRVPHFQRDFRWESQDIVRLFDSIVNDYPIGNLLLWVRDSPEQQLVLGRLTLDAPPSSEALWVVDGQQRITSLANALHPDGHHHPPFTVYYDLEERRFVPNPKAKLGPEHIALPVLFDLEKLIGWFAAEGRGEANHFPEAQRVAKKLRQYKVPAYLVRQQDPDVLTDIFDRMNNYGKRLRRAEIFSALFAGSEESAQSALSLEGIAEQVAVRTGFGRINTDTVLSSILARRGPDPARDIRNEFEPTNGRTDAEFRSEDRDTAYEQGMAALIRAVEFLREHAGVPHVAMLAYQAPLVVLTRFFALFPEPKANTLRLLRRLYWQVVVSGAAVFRSSFTTVDRVLSARIQPGDEEAAIAALMDAVAEAKPTKLNPARFKTNEATAKIVLSSWWSRGPRSLASGEPYDGDALSSVLADQTTAAVAAHRVFRSGLTAEQQLLAANRLFLPTDTESVNEIPRQLRTPPESLNPDVWDAVLDSHCLNHQMVEALDHGDEALFLAMRQQVIAEQLNGFLSRMAEWEYEDTPTLDSLDLDDLDEVSDVPQ